jgi:hypothetical protein
MKYLMKHGIMKKKKYILKKNISYILNKIKEKMKI